MRIRVKMGFYSERNVNKSKSEYEYGLWQCGILLGLEVMPIGFYLLLNRSTRRPFYTPARKLDTDLWDIKN